MESLIHLREELAEVQAELIVGLPQKAGISPSRIVAVSVHDPGCWFGSSGSPGYIGLCDPARLAELTGMNIIDAFAARIWPHAGKVVRYRLWRSGFCSKIERKIVPFWIWGIRSSLVFFRQIPTHWLRDAFWLLKLAQDAVVGPFGPAVDRQRA